MIEPDEISDDVSLDYLNDMKQSFFTTKVAVSHEEAKPIEMNTLAQSGSELWMKERKMRITASQVGGILKMKKSTKKGNKVKSILYSTFRGNEVTRYGTNMEETSRQEYVMYQQQHGHPGLTVHHTGLVISTAHPWLAASPDDRVSDPDEPHPLGLAEYKNPFAARNLTLPEACAKVKSFCLEKQKGQDSYKLKRRHDYYYQVQC